MTLHHVDDGPRDAPVVLLGGSLGTTHAMWAPQIAALSATHRVIAFDHRGHGASPVPPGPYEIGDLGGDVVALMDALDVAHAAYVGLSIGGMVGQWLGVEAAERIDALVLIATTAHFAGDPAQWSERAQTVRDAGSPAPLAETVVERWFTPEWAAANSATVERMRDVLAATPAEGYASCCEAIGTMDLRPGLPAISAPTTVIHCRDDPSISFEQGEAIAQAIPGARFVALDPGRHVPTVERPDDLTALIREGIER